MSKNNVLGLALALGLGFSGSTVASVQQECTLGGKHVTVVCPGIEQMWVAWEDYAPPQPYVSYDLGVHEGEGLNVDEAPVDNGGTPYNPFNQL